MISRNDIETIEHLFGQYCSYQSEIMFNYHTDNFFDNLLSLDFANEVISGLVVDNPVEEKLFKERQCTEWFSYYEDIICHGHEYYLAYCIQYYHYLRQKANPFKPYFDRIIWTDKSASETGDRTSLFKTDFVRPIVDYVINAYNAENHIVHLIRRYCERVERFRELVGVHDEQEIQRQFSRYLFDSGCNFHRESNTNNGQLDFYIETTDGAIRSSWECCSGQYIVEVKVFKDIHQIQTGMSQLLAYTNQINAHGCLLVFTETELMFQNIPAGITVLTAYVGDKTPSKRDKAMMLDFYINHTHDDVTLNHIVKNKQEE